MGLYNKLKSIWKKLDINGQVINYSSKELWVIETKNGPVARILRPGYKTPIKLDIDGFKRVDGKAIEKHKNWWKFYDFSTVDVFDNGANLKISVITKIAVDENHFKKPKYLKGLFGEPIRAIVDIRRNKKGVIEQYKISDIGWVSFEDAFKMVCYHEIDNARPVFPKNGKPYIRSKRDKSILNNLSLKGKA
ncbi:MAG: DUF3892 domain-containing protein [Bacteriovoracaceae bacterium]